MAQDTRARVIHAGKHPAYLVIFEGSEVVQEIELTQKQLLLLAHDSITASLYLDRIEKDGGS